MRAPAFFDAPRPTLLARVLSPLGWAYGALTAARMRRSGEICGVRVVCAGNFTAGGAGKTPLAMEIARILIAEGECPFVLTRGHGGSESGPLRVDPARHDFRAVGDEPLLLAEVAPVIVARDRRAGARAAVEQGASVIVMDDGLQNPHLRKDLTFAVVDAAVGAGNNLCLPAGPLRAPLGAQLPFVDALVLVGAGAAGDALVRSAGKPVLRARLAPDCADGAFRGARVVAFAGIGRPEKFFATLRDLGAELVGAHAFADHHPYTGPELEALARRAAGAGARLVTTRKDRARLPRDFAVEALDVRMRFEPADALKEILTAR